MLNGGNEIREGVALGEHLSGVVPWLAQVASAAHVRIGHYRPAIKQAQPIGAEGQRQRVAVGTVAINVEGIPSLFTFVFSINQRDRNLRAVGRSGMNALACVKGAVEAAGNLQLLEQRGCAGGHVVLVDRSRRHQ